MFEIHQETLFFEIFEKCFDRNVTVLWFHSQNVDFLTLSRYVSVPNIAVSKYHSFWIIELGRS